MAQTKALARAITEIPCLVVAEMSTKSFYMYLEAILVNSAVRHNCGKIRENALNSTLVK